MITGAGSGFGRATAQRFAADGYRVVLADIDGESVEVGAAELGGASVAVATATDVTDETSVTAMVETAMREFGRIDVLVNNAGLTRKGGPIDQTPLEEWEFVFAVNVTGVFLCTKHAIEALRKDGGGVILNMSSIAPLIPRRHTLAYTASKAAVLTITQAAALELAPEIRVNCVCPSAAETGFLAGRAEGDPAALARMEAALRESHNIPLGRLAEPAEIAAALAFLASDEAAYISGVVLPVDGARSAGNPE